MRDGVNRMKTPSDYGAAQVERWLSVAEVARHLGVKQVTLYKWLEREKLPAYKVGRLWKFKLSEIDSWVREGKMAKSEGSS